MSTTRRKSLFAVLILLVVFAFTNAACSATTGLLTMMSGQAIQNANNEKMSPADNTVANWWIDATIKANILSLSQDKANVYLVHYGNLSLYPNPFIYNVSGVNNSNYTTNNPITYTGTENNADCNHMTDDENTGADPIYLTEGNTGTIDQTKFLLAENQATFYRAADLARCEVSLRNTIVANTEISQATEGTMMLNVQTANLGVNSQWTNGFHFSHETDGSHAIVNRANENMTVAYDLRDTSVGP